MDIEMTIDRLVIEGPALDPTQRAALRDALTTTLEQLLAGTTDWRPAATATVTASEIKAAGNNQPGTDHVASLGRALARTIYEGIRP
ncbi:hypothetical protein [Arthrobacter sp. N199823]|uniref:hypothetical protein n=1 Tax=Arthrobacter sp. N199823 TaxID=2058895 RepID=UPI000CE495ED|nr:hypothetical protein [Arthrobacter sp. N199823]